MVVVIMFDGSITMVINDQELELRGWGDKNREEIYWNKSIFSPECEASFFLSLSGGWLN